MTLRATFSSGRVSKGNFSTIKGFKTVLNCRCAMKFSNWNFRKCLVVSFKINFWKFFKKCHGIEIFENIWDLCILGLTICRLKNYKYERILKILSNLGICLLFKVCKKQGKPLKSLIPDSDVSIVRHLNYL